LRHINDITTTTTTNNNNCPSHSSKEYTSYLVVAATAVIVKFVLIGHRRTGRAGRHGYAYTFISPSQGKYAGEIIKALELSSTTVSDELTQLWEKYKQEAEAVMSLCVII